MRISAVFSLFWLSLLTFSASAQRFGGNCGSCGGDQFRFVFVDLAVDTFQELEKVAPETPDLKTLQKALLDSLNKNELKLIYSYYDEKCPLVDDGGNCVTFLTQVATKQVSIDVGRLVRSQVQINVIQRGLIHEAYRLAVADRLVADDDWNYQRSRRLAEALRSMTIRPEILNGLVTLKSNFNLRGGHRALAKKISTKLANCKLFVENPKDHSATPWGSAIASGTSLDYSAAVNSPEARYKVMVTLVAENRAFLVEVQKNEKPISFAHGYYPEDGSDIGYLSVMLDDPAVHSLWVSCSAY